MNRGCDSESSGPEHVGGASDASLPLDADPSLGFLDPEVVEAVQARLEEGDHSGIIERDRLFRNLLSSQPACFNLQSRLSGVPEDQLLTGLDAEA